jgi:hypothetical protein
MRRPTLSLVRWNCLPQWQVIVNRDMGQDYLVESPGRLHPLECGMRASSRTDQPYRLAITAPARALGRGGVASPLSPK